MQLTTDPGRSIRYRNALIGLAAGDAWGYQVEFTPYPEMPSYPVDPPPGIWRVSDDTQMTLAVHRALVDVAGRTGDVDEVTAALTSRFAEWFVDPDNDRAPGRACMTSIWNELSGARWFDLDGAVKSAGCGAVMRLTPAAFADARHWRGVVALQALITHNHPRAVVPALLLADAIRNAPVRHGQFLDCALTADGAVRAGQAEELLDDPLLKEVLALTGAGDVSSYLVTGLDDGTVEALLAARERLSQLRRAPRDLDDLCAGVGQGWESASAVALGLLVADLATPDPATGTAVVTPANALAWAATTNGDSDSIACIAGAVIGAANPTRNYWARHGVRPRFEARYTKDLRAATMDELAAQRQAV